MANWTDEQIWQVLAQYTDVGEQTVVGVGRAETRVPRVRLFWSTVPTGRSSSVVDAGIVVLLAGTKVGHAHQNEFVYDPNHYLVVSASIPYEYSSRASEEHPVIGLFIELDIAELSELAVSVAEPAESSDTPVGLEAVPIDPKMGDAIRRLLDALTSPEEAAVLGAGLVREIVFRALTGPGAHVLRLLTTSKTRQADLARLILEIKSDVQSHRSIEELAKRVSMSPTTFHRAFKSFTGDSPLQYIKKVRLHKASGLLVYDGLSVSETASRVGYESATQFSREFKRLFGQSPSAVQKIGETSTKPKSHFRREHE